MSSSSATSPAQKRPWAGRLVVLLFFLLVCVAIAGVRYWQTEQRKQWLQTASINDLAIAAGKDESDIAVFEALGEKTRKDQQWARAARAFQHACELAPDRVANYVGWARCVYEIGGFQPADAILTAFIKDHPDSGQAYMERAALRRIAKRREAAMADILKATELTPNDGNAWALRGDLSLDVGIDGEAEVAYSKAQTLMPGSTWPYVGKYQTAIQLRRFDTALSIARQINEKFPNLKEAKLYVGEALIENAKTAEDNEKARSVLVELEKDAGDLTVPNRFSLETLLGRTYVNQNRWKEAIPHLNVAYQLLPDNPENLYLLARAYRGIGDVPHAEEFMKRNRQAYEDVAFVRRHRALISDAPTDPAPRLELARWYRKRGALGSAQVEYEEMISRGIDAETAKQEMKAMEVTGATP